MGIRINGRLRRGLTKVYDQEATAGQTQFTVTPYSIDDNFQILIDEISQRNVCSRSLQTITYPPGCDLGARVVIWN